MFCGTSFASPAIPAAPESSAIVRLYLFFPLLELSLGQHCLKVKLDQSVEFEMESRISIFARKCGPKMRLRKRAFSSDSGDFQ